MRTTGVQNIANGFAPGIYALKRLGERMVGEERYNLCNTAMNMYEYLHDTVRYCCHSPRGECGLKFDVLTESAIDFTVTPREGSVD